MEVDRDQLGRSQTLPPWAAAFDPAGNLRALTDLQRRGLEAAQQLTDRLAGAVDGTAGPVPPASNDSGGVASGLDGLVDLWAQLTKGALRVVVGQLNASTPNQNGDGGDGVGPDRSVSVVVANGSGGSTEIWLHNETQGDQTNLRPHCGELRAADGALLAADVVFEPPTIAVLPSRSSKGVMLRVGEPPAGTVPGTYRGVVLVDGLPDAWLTLTVRITS